MAGPAVLSAEWTKSFVRDNREFICGWGAANCNILVTFPMHKVIFRQMVHDVSILSAIKQISNEGVFNLYRGVLPPLVQKAISISLMFGMYEKFRTPLLQRNCEPYLAKAIAAMAAGTVEVAMVPLERMQTLLQLEKFHADLINMKHTMNVLWTRYGFVEFYRGTVPIFFRNGPSNAMFFILKDEARDRLPEPSNLVAAMAKQFVVGALVGAVCSSVFYPLNVIKTHMQSQVGGPFQSMYSAAVEIYVARSGVRGFFRGVHLNFTRSCLSWGVINVAYESIKSILTFDEDMEI